MSRCHHGVTCHVSRVVVSCRGATCYGVTCHGVTCHCATCHGVTCHGATCWMVSRVMIYRIHSLITLLSMCKSQQDRAYFFITIRATQLSECSLYWFTELNLPVALCSCSLAVIMIQHFKENIQKPVKRPQTSL